MIERDAISRLKELIGQTVQYGEQRARILELLEDQQALVLELVDAAPVIQANQIGDASRRVGRTLTVPIFSSDGTGLNPLLQSIRLAGTRQ